MKSIVARRAARGAALMDEVCPGWFNRIKLGDLAINSLEDCILGQIYGSFRKGCAEIRIRRNFLGC